MIRLVKLLTPDGYDVWVNPDLVCSISKAQAGEGSSGAKTLIRLADGSIRFVREPLEAAIAILQETAK